MVVFAMEYKPISTLNIALPAGTKVLITGPVECINKVLFLEPKNIEVLGGEVDDLLVVNAYENVLLKALKKPINPNPKLKYDNEMSFQNGTANPAITQALNNHQTNAARNGVTNSRLLPPPSAPIIEVESEDLFEDDDILYQLDFDALQNMASTNTVSSAQQVPERTQDSGIALTASARDQPTAANSWNSTSSSNTRLNVQNPKPAARSLSPKRPLAMPSTSAVKPPSPKRSHLDEDFDDFDLSVVENLSEEFESMPPSHVPAFQSKPSAPVASPVQEIKKPPEVDSTEYKFKIEGCNVLTLAQLYSIPKQRWNGKVFVFFPAQRQVVKPLHIAKGAEPKWALQVTIQDGTDDKLQVSFCPQFLERSIGYSTAEMNLMKSKMKTQPALKDQVMKALDEFTPLLTNTSKLWKVSFAAEQGQVVNIVDIKTVYKMILQTKVETEKLECVRKRLSG